MVFIYFWTLAALFLVLALSNLALATEKKGSPNSPHSLKDESKGSVRASAIRRQRGKLRIGLHAQVSPASGMIVGSVITTTGLKNAFEKRHRDVEVVHLLNPSNYSQFFSVTYDLIIIEGWFPSIDKFIAVTRSVSPDVIIFFYCLDPSFPDIKTITSLDVDGYLSNSKILMRDVLSKVAPSIYLPLAADPDSMAPVQSLAQDRDINIVYIGAGGGMVNAKPQLYKTLKVASRYGLSIYGSWWSEIPDLVPFWKGVLPLDNISYAYSRAKIVLASTIASQVEYGMVNNRIFEALSCGAVIIAERFPALEEMFGSAMLYTSSEEETERLVKFVLGNAEKAESMRAAARSTILQKHTWGHRIIDILSLFDEIRSRRMIMKTIKSGGLLKKGAIEARNIVTLGNQLLASYSTPSTGNESLMSLGCARKNCLRLAFIVSDDNNNEIAKHPDFTFFVKSFLLNELTEVYATVVFTEEEWLAHIAIENEGQLFWSIEVLQSYDLILGVITAFDSLDLHLNRIVGSGDLLAAQRVACYLFGVSGDTIEQVISASDKNMYFFHDFSRYDLVITRMREDVEHLSSVFGAQVDPRRLVQIFGFDTFNSIESPYSYIMDTPDLSRSNNQEEAVEHSREPSAANLSSELHVCLWKFVEFCDIIKSPKIDKIGDKIVLLLGETLESFVSSGHISPNASIHNIYALNEHNRDLIVTLFKSVEKVVVNIPYHLMQSPVEIVWWPLVLATHLQRRVHLIGTNSLVTNVLPITPSWGPIHLREQLSDILLRIHLFPRTQSSFTTTKLSTLNPTLSQHVIDNNGGSEEKALSDKTCLINRMSLATPLAFNSAEQRFNIAVFEIAYSLIRPGHDVTLCMAIANRERTGSNGHNNESEQIESSLANDLSCSLWPFKYIVPVLHNKDNLFFLNSEFSPESCSGCAIANVTLSLQVKPLMSLDVFVSSVIELYFDRDETASPSSANLKSIIPSNLSLVQLDSNTCIREILFYPIDI